MLRGVAHFTSAFGEGIKDDNFVERLGQLPARKIAQEAKLRLPGSMGYAEIMLINYNKNRKASLAMDQLHIFCC